MMKGCSQTSPRYSAVNSSTDPERSGLILTDTQTQERSAGPPQSSSALSGGHASTGSGRLEASGSVGAHSLAAQRISIRGARTHNLKNIDLDIPRNQLVVKIGRAHV